MQIGNQKMSRLVVLIKIFMWMIHWKSQQTTHMKSII